MKHALVRILMILSLPICANAETVSTDLFSISIPDGWKISEDPGLFLSAAPNTKEKGLSFPLLMVKYCSEFGNSKCAKPCSESAKGVRMGDEFLPIIKITKGKNMVEYRSRTRPELDPSWFPVIYTTLSCSSTGQAYLSFITNEPYNSILEQLFDETLQSLTWK